MSLTLERCGAWACFSTIQTCVCLTDARMTFKKVIFSQCVVFLFLRFLHCLLSCFAYTNLNVVHLYGPERPATLWNHSLKYVFLFYFYHFFFLPFNLKVNSTYRLWSAVSVVWQFTGDCGVKTQWHLILTAALWEGFHSCAQIYSYSENISD